MIKTKLKTILNAQGAIQKLSEQSLPIVVSYRITKMIKVLSDELMTYEKHRIELCQKYGHAIEGKNEYQIDKMEEFEKELLSLWNMDIELSVEKISLPKTLAMSPKDLISLLDFVEIEED